MTAGPLVAAAGVAGLTRLNPRSSYVSGVLPSVLVLGLGLSITVAPLTATVLAAVSQRHTGLASAFNNAVARVGGLLAVAVLPLIVGLSGAAYRSARLMTP